MIDYVALVLLVLCMSYRRSKSDDLLIHLQV
jgi:hypothetical protein